MPLVIGVTGHRDVVPGDVALLKESVRGVFDELRQKYPHTPLLLLTPLAEGADRLVAEVALERDIALVAPLPMKRELYEADFRAADAPAEPPSPATQDFRTLLGKTKRWFELPVVPGFTWDQVERKEGPARELQYLLVGLYVARHCQVLIALWDGKTPGSTGGTWQVVKYKQTGLLPELPADQRQALERLPPPFGFHDPIVEEPETGPVYHVPTRRQKHYPNAAPLAEKPTPTPLAPGTPSGPSGPSGRPPPAKPQDSLARRRRKPVGSLNRAVWHCFWFVNDASGWLVILWTKFLGLFYKSKELTAEQVYFHRFHRLQKHIDHFNALVEKLLVDGTWKEKRDSLLTKEEFAQLSTALPPDQHAALLRLASAYAVTDKLALHFQSRTLRTLKALIFMVLGAVVLFGIYAHLGGESWKLWFAAGYILVLASADSFYLAARKEGQQDKHQDYRTLAEGLRVQFYWRLSGMPDSAAEHYLSKQRSELDWIRHAVQAWGVLTPAAGVPQFLLVSRYWIKHDTNSYYGQANYYNSAGPRDLHYSILYRELGSGFLIASLGLTTLAAAFGENLSSAAYLRDFPPLAHAAFVLALPVAIAIGIRHLMFKLRELREEKGIGGGEEIQLHFRYGLSGVIFAVLLFAGLMSLREVLLWMTGTELPGGAPADVHWKTDIQDWLIVAMATFALLTALLHTFAERRGFAEQQKQYRRMSGVFERAKSRLDHLTQTGDTGAAQAVLLELGHEALAEHADWLLLHRERPMEMPRVEL
jgi:hypothetical protein